MDDTTIEYLRSRPSVRRRRIRDRVRAGGRSSATRTRVETEIVLRAEDIVPSITGARTRRRSSRSTASFLADRWTIPTRKRRRNAHSPTWGSPRHAVRSIQLTWCSLVRARIRASRTCARRLARQGRQVAEGVRALVVPGSHRVKRQAEPKGSTRSFSTPLRVARTGLFDVSGNEPGPTRRRNALCVDVESKFRRSPGPRGRTHSFSAVARPARSWVDSRHRRSCRETRSRRRRTAVPLERSTSTPTRYSSDWLKRVERTGFGETVQRVA